MIRKFSMAVFALIGLTVCLGNVQAQMPADVEGQFAKVDLKWDEVEAWREHIEPTDTELKWMKIPWLPTFSEGIVEGAKASKPILLWTMNGHPLGCT